MKQPTGFAKRILTAGSWSLFGHAFSILLRFGSNLILTRLLFPEAFGLMSIVQTVMFGIMMLADFGIQLCIIRREKDPEPEFLHTAWTFQILQGLFISIVFIAVSPIIKNIYDQPILADMMPLVGLNALISGFNSTKLAILNRKLIINKVVILESLNGFLSTFATIILAWLWPSVWALVWGGLFASFLKLFSSHYLIAGTPDRLGWDKKALRELTFFGKWIIMRSSLTFFDGEGNKLLLGMFLGIKTLAFFNIANTLNLMAFSVVQTVSGKVLISAYSEVLRERPERINAVMTKCRLAFIGVGWTAALFFIFFGNQFVDLLYDHRYTDSGPLLRVLAMGSLVSIITSSYAHILTAKGLLRTSTVLLLIKVITQFSMVIIGFILFGESGVIFAVAFSEWIYFVVNCIGYAKVGLWQSKIDLLFFSIATILTVLVIHYSTIDLPVYQASTLNSNIERIVVDYFQQLLNELHKLHLPEFIENLLDIHSSH